MSGCSQSNRQASSGAVEQYWNEQIELLSPATPSWYLKVLPQQSSGPSVNLVSSFSLLLLSSSTNLRLPFFARFISPLVASRSSPDRPRYVACIPPIHVTARPRWGRVLAALLFVITALIRFLSPGSKATCPTKDTTTTALPLPLRRKSARLWVSVSHAIAGKFSTLLSIAYLG